MGGRPSEREESGDTGAGGGTELSRGDRLGLERVFRGSRRTAGGYSPQSGRELLPSTRSRVSRSAGCVCPGLPRRERRPGPRRRCRLRPPDAFPRLLGVTRAPLAGSSPGYSFPARWLERVWPARAPRNGGWCPGGDPQASPAKLGRGVRSSPRPFPASGPLLRSHPCGLRFAGVGRAPTLPSRPPRL